MKQESIELRCQRETCRCYRNPKGKLVGRVLDRCLDEVENLRIELSCPLKKSRLIIPVVMPANKR